MTREPLVTVSDPKAESWRALTPDRVREILKQIKEGPPPAPEIAGIFYRGRTHGLPGKRDAGKSLFMALVSLGLLDAGGRVLWIDHEMGAQLVLRRLIEFGGDEDAIAERFHLVDDARGLPQKPEVLKAYAGVDLVVLDAMTGQMSRANLDDNSATDVDQVYDAICKPLAQKHGACVVVIDHVPHGDKDRPLGSQRKSSAPDVELLLENVTRFKPGMGGRAKITVKRDRFGRIPNAEIVLEPDMTWRIETRETPGEFRPTILMQRVSEYLEAQTEPVSKARIERDVAGKRVEHVRLALTILIDEGHVTTEHGARGALLCTSTKPYRDPDSTSSQVVPTSSDEVTEPTSSTSSTSSTNGRGDGRGRGATSRAATSSRLTRAQAAWYEVDQ